MERLRLAILQLSITHNPFQGLKPHMPQTSRRSIFLSITHNPFQGLKRYVWLVAFSWMPGSQSHIIPFRDWNWDEPTPRASTKVSSQSHIIPFRDWNCIDDYKRRVDFWLSITHNPFQGLKLGRLYSKISTLRLSITHNPFQGLKQPEWSQLL